MKGISPVTYASGELKILDQTLLPHEIRYITCRTHSEVVAAIREMKVRGAPAIGAAAAYGMVLGVREYAGRGEGEFRAHIEKVREELLTSRPTAVNLSFAVERVARAIENCSGPEEALAVAVEAADLIAEEDMRANMHLSRLGAELVPKGARILTHCNAGALATTGYGTAVGVIRTAWAESKVQEVYVTETRPLLQGSRLTAWELQQEGIPVTVVADTAAGYLMRSNLVDLVIVGADRIAANGDVANKIGTYQLAVLARRHGIPFYVAAPWSSVDPRTSRGDDIPIELRNADEVLSVLGHRIAPAGVKAWNPAFDVTPGDLVTAIITDRGVARPPYEEALRELGDCLQKGVRG